MTTAVTQLKKLDVWESVLRLWGVSFFVKRTETVRLRVWVSGGIVVHPPYMAVDRTSHNSLTQPRSL